MGSSELWTEAYQGEVLGEALFGALAGRETDPARRAHLELLTLLERSTKELAEPLLERQGIARGDTDATLAGVAGMVDAVAAMTWQEFLASIEPVASRYLEIYRRLVDLAGDADERAVAEAYVAHELALASFARRALGQEDGDPVEPVLALAHVAAAV
jgi:hypothetical protein